MKSIVHAIVCFLAYCLRCERVFQVAIGIFAVGLLLAGIEVATPGTFSWWVLAVFFAPLLILALGVCAFFVGMCYLWFVQRGEDE